MSLRRIVAVVARARAGLAVVAAARVRLKAMTAQTNQDPMANHAHGETPHAHPTSSLVMLPRKAAWEAVRAHTLPAVLRDQLHVVLTSIGGLLTGPEARVHLYAVHAAGERPPEFVLHRTWVLERRLDVRITVPGYGSGLLALIRV